MKAAEAWKKDYLTEHDAYVKAVNKIAALEEKLAIDETIIKTLAKSVA